MSATCWFPCFLLLMTLFPWTVGFHVNKPRSRTKPTINDRPIIGIVGLDSKSSPKKTWISATYVKYLEQAGARVVPIRGNQSPAYYSQIVEWTNGVLFPGGAVSFVSSQFARSARYVWDKALELNRDGDYYPIWGTCMGFQIMCNLTVGRNLLQATDSDNASWPIDLVHGYATSRLLGSAPKEILHYLSKESVTQNQHHYSILTKTFDSSVLSKFFIKLSTNKDRKGKEFISTVEARKYPIYGTQWHPEKNSFNWRPNYVINHSDHAVKVGQYMADFFVNEARKNNHRFPDVMSEINHVIQNYPMVYQKDGSFDQIYYMD